MLFRISLQHADDETILQADCLSGPILSPPLGQARGRIKCETPIWTLLCVLLGLWRFRSTQFCPAHDTMLRHLSFVIKHAGNRSLMCLSKASNCLLLPQSKKGGATSQRRSFISAVHEDDSQYKRCVTVYRL